MAKRQTEAHPAVPAMVETCGRHESMLTKTEFRWVLGMLIPLILAAAGLFFASTASQDQVFSIDREIVTFRNQLSREREERKELKNDVRQDIQLLREEMKDGFRQLGNAIQQKKTG